MFLDQHVELLLLIFLIYLLPPTSQNIQEEESHEKEEKIVDRVPQFTTQSQTKLINHGETIRLPCFVDKLEGFVLLWKHGDTIISVGTRVISFPDKRAKIISENNGNWLVIESSRLEDEGIYTCQSSAVPPKEISHRLMIRTRPDIRAMQDNVVVREGDNVELSCYIKSGAPQPEIVWSKSSSREISFQTRVGSGPSLELNQVNHSLAGMYRCRADNGFPVYSEDIVNLVVLHKPYVSNKHVFVHSAGDSDDLVDLGCEVVAYPRPKIRWFFLDSKSQQPRPMKDVKTRREDSKFSISIPGRILGKYRCEVENEYGADFSYITVSNQVGPLKFQSSEVGNSSVVYNLTWTGHSSPPVSEYKINIYKNDVEFVNTQVVPSHVAGKVWSGWYVFGELDPRSVYTVKIAGVNEHGQGPYFGPWKFGPDPHLMASGVNPINRQFTSILILHVFTLISLNH